MFRIYFVLSGVNASHLHDIKKFDRLKDAKEHINKLTHQSYRLEYQTYQSRKAFYPVEWGTIEEGLFA